MSTFETFTDRKHGGEYKFKRMKDGRRWLVENYRANIVGSMPANAEDVRKAKVNLGRLYPWEIALRATPPGCSFPTYDDWEALRIAHGGWSGLNADDFGVEPMQISMNGKHYSNYSDTMACFWTSSEPKFNIFGFALSGEWRDHRKRSRVMIKFGYSPEPITEWSHELAAVRYIIRD